MSAHNVTSPSSILFSSTLKRTALAVGIALTSLSTHAAIPSGMIENTIYDGSGSGTGWYGTQEDQEVEPNNVTAQSWDLEGTYKYGANKLAMIGGFDFKNGNEGYTSGDIFIDVLGNAHTPAPVTPHADGYNTVNDNFGYQYALHIDWANSTYDVIGLNAATQNMTVFYNQNSNSNPFKYISGGTLIGSGVFTVESGLTDAQADGKLGGAHFAAYGFDLSFLGAGTNYITHFTYGCGNDNLMGQDTISSVPLPASVWFMGTSLAGLLAVGRRKKIAYALK